MPRILVTNDDGIDSPGLHALARAATALGDVVVVAPDSEYSGASVALGALHLIHPEVHETAVAGVEEAWAVSGPPALCVYFARLGVFGAGFDLVLSGINPGANVGRSVMHSGTVGAALTAVAGGINAVAVSQAVPGSVEGQSVDDDPITGQLWESAADIGVLAGRSLLEQRPDPAIAINVNVPNLAVDEIAGWRRTTLAPAPARGIGTATMVPKPGAEGTYTVKLAWGSLEDLPPDSDGGAVAQGLVSISVLTRMTAADPAAPLPATEALDALFAGRPAPSAEG